MAKKKENPKGMSKDELEVKLAELRESLRILHFKVEGSKSKNVKEAQSIKRQIARVLTEINADKKSK
ncbi:MAG TPA: 50S ribosomal protein L29 [Candidatus Paceibacterota bacterium]|nr:50S ribosomal protein L29 [Candidatus Paceibacterota bacterium]HPT18286.1 50S ribosomal protein L29 [Candidatus Paceibacterota bacterium]